MAEPYVLTGLLAKRAEIAGKIEHLQDQLRQVVVDLNHIDASIHIFDPSIELRDPLNGRQLVQEGTGPPRGSLLY